MPWMTCPPAFMDYFSSMVSRSTLNCSLSSDLPSFYLWLDNFLAPFDLCVDLRSLLPSFDCHVGLEHSWTCWCTLGHSWSSHLCSTTTEFGWTGLQRWSWKYWWSSDPHPISYEWDSQGSRDAHGLHGHGACWAQNWSSSTAQDGSILAVLCCHPSWKSNLLCWRHRTWIWSCLLPVEQDDEPPWMVG